MVSEAGCPLVWGGSGLKPFTPMGVAMLGTGAVLIPGGVLVPAGARRQRRRHPESAPRGCQVANAGVLPEEGVRGAATSPLTLKAAICCIWAAAMAAMGLRQVPCAAAIRAACCCMIFGKESERQGEGGRREGKSPSLLWMDSEMDSDPGTGGGLGDTKYGTTAPYSHPQLWGGKPCAWPSTGIHQPCQASTPPGTGAFMGQTTPPTHGAPPKPPVCTRSYRLRVGPVGTELDGHGVEDAQLPCHLMHPPQGPLLICVCKLHHQAG